MEGIGFRVSLGFRVVEGLGFREHGNCGCSLYR